MRKFLNSYISNIIYNQAIIPLYDYGDFFIEGGARYYQDRLDSLHEKALRIIDCKPRSENGRFTDDIWFR